MEQFLIDDIPFLVVDGVKPMSHICRTFSGVVAVDVVSTSPDVLVRRAFFTEAPDLVE